MRNTTRTYRSAMSRLKEAAGRIAGLSGRDPDVRDLVLALAIRSLSVSAQTANVEISALRHYARSTTRDPETGRIGWNPEVDPPEWMKIVREDHWTEFQDGLTRTRTGLLDLGRSVAQSLEGGSIRSGIAESIDEVVSWIAGDRQASRKDAAPKRAKTVTISHLRAIDMRLSRHDPEIGLQTLGSGQAVDMQGLARIFTRTIWVTGMRPAELWTAVLFVPRPDMLMTDALRDVIRFAPRHAIAMDLMTPVEQLPRLSGESLGDAAMAACGQAEAPAILVIRSSKQTNANQETRDPYRIQILDTGIPREHLEMIALGCQLRHAGVDEIQTDSVRAGVNKVLADVCADIPGLKGQKVTLYTMRHAFATRMKVRGDLAEAAALIGHTSIRSIYRYGRLRAKAAGGSGWAPTADPGQVEALRKSWGQDGAPDVDPQAEAGAPPESGDPS